MLPTSMELMTYHAFSRNSLSTTSMRLKQIWNALMMAHHLCNLKEFFTQVVSIFYLWVFKLCMIYVILSYLNIYNNDRNFPNFTYVFIDFSNYDFYSEQSSGNNSATLHWDRKSMNTFMSWTWRNVWLSDGQKS